MPEDRPHHDRYDVSGNLEALYMDAHGAVLVNKPGITDLETLQIAEEEALARAYESLLRDVRVDTPITCGLIRLAHERIFGGLFHWAGRWRTVWLQKPGVTWPPPDFLDEAMAVFELAVLKKYPASQLADDEAFCAAVGEIQGEFLVIHPFREGNARTIKLVTNLLAVQSGRPLLVYDQSEAGRDAYIEGAKAAFKRDYSRLAAIIRQALAAARR